MDDLEPPPHDLDAEHSVLGSVLLNPSALPSVMGALAPKDFYRVANGHIYSAALELARRGQPIDNVTVAALLEERGQLAMVGGRAHLALLEQGVPTSENIRAYAEIVLEKSIRRTLINIGNRLATRALDPAETVEGTLEALQSTIVRLQEQRTERRRELKLEERPDLKLVHGSAPAAQAPGDSAARRAGQTRS